MSTRPIREALGLLIDYATARPPIAGVNGTYDAYEAAMEAVAVIENMAKTLVPAMTEEIRASRLPHAASVLESIAKEAP